MVDLRQHERNNVSVHDHEPPLHDPVALRQALDRLEAEGGRPAPDAIGVRGEARDGHLSASVLVCDDVESAKKTATQLIEAVGFAVGALPVARLLEPLASTLLGTVGDGGPAMPRGSALDPAAWRRGRVEDAVPRVGQ